MCLGSMTVQTPQECNTRFVEVFITSHTLQLQWNPINASALECPDNVQYGVSYRCCSDTSWQPTTCTGKTSIEFQLSEIGCEIENRAVFSVRVEGSNSVNRHVEVDFQNDTGMKTLVQTVL